MSPPNPPEPLSGNDGRLLLSSEELNKRLEQQPGAKAALKVGRTLLEKGHQAVIAGGAVRDLLMGGKPKDFDIATDARPEEVLKCFRRTRKVGIAFGVVLVSDFKDTVEVATFRTDLEYLDGRRPEGVVFTDAKNDAQRRDFTVNGLFLDLENFEIVDHVGGMSDLEARVLRAIGDPERRFAEDYLRMLRAVRFAVRLGFEIENQTASVIKAKVHFLKDIAPDRIHEELSKAFSVAKSDRALTLLKDFGMLEVLFADPPASWELPEDHDGQEGGDYAAVLSLLLRNRGRSELDRILKDLRSTNEEKRSIQAFVRILSGLRDYGELKLSQKKRLLRGHPKDQLRFMILRCPELEGCQKDILENLVTWKEDDLFPPTLPTGQDLLKKGYTPGPHLGKLLNELEVLLLEGSLSSQEDVENYLKNH